MKQTQHAFTRIAHFVSALSLISLLAACASTGTPGSSNVPGGPSANITPPAKVAESRPAALPRRKPEPVTTAPVSESQGSGDSEAAKVATTEAASDQPKDLWERMRKGFSMPPLDTPLVAEKEQFYLSQPAYLQRMMTRGSHYLYFIVEELEARHMPLELALLPFVESAMNPTALSSAKAAGLWQFVPSTGRAYDLKQNWWVDNRRDVVKSTRAALDYLQKIYAMNDNDWFLALASYNWGEGSVMRAVKSAKARGLSGDYLSLNMPAETRQYVPKLIALKNILMHAEELNISLPPLPNKPYFVTIEKTRPIDLKLAAKFAGMSVDEFVALNPAHNRPVIAASKNNEIKLPADRVEAFLAAVRKHTEENRVMATWQPYTVKPGETLSQVAARGGVSESELRHANGLRREARILPGTKLLAPHAEVADESKVESFVAPRVYEQVSVPAQYHTVGRKESLMTIARRYGLSVATLKAWNGIKRTAARGMNLLVRPSYAQTVLTEESGQRQVVASQPAPRMIQIAARAEEADRAEKTEQAEKVEEARNAARNKRGSKHPAPAARLERTAKGGKAKLVATRPGKPVAAAKASHQKGHKLAAGKAVKAEKTAANRNGAGKLKSDSKATRISGKKGDKLRKA